MRNRILELKQKEFNLKGAAGVSGSTGAPLDFSKIRIGAKELEDAVFSLGNLKKTNPSLADKGNILRAIDQNDLKTMREVSNFFYRISGIYSRLVKHMASLYRYDWYVTPYVYDKSVKKEKLMEGFNGSLSTLDNFNMKLQLGEIAQKIILNGVYYGYKEPYKNTFVLQELPPNYCRSQFKQGNKWAVEFNMKYFDDAFKDQRQKEKFLKLFPAEFRKGYNLYREGKLPPEFPGDTNGWYLLDINNTVRFTVNGEEYPFFISTIPLLIDLDEAQALDRKKTLQRLLKIIIQKMPMDKNGDLIFEMEEAQQLHNNAVMMLKRAIGVDVLTTYADVEVADMDASSTTAQQDDLLRAERQVYNEAGVPQLLFNTDKNISSDKAISNDEATLYSMLLQFEIFANDLIQQYNKSVKKYEYKVQFLPTTIYNYKELAKIYKEQMQVGYSKILAQVALGQSQSSILATAYFENDVLDLVNVFIPPLMSSTMNADILNRVKGGNETTNNGNDASKTGTSSATGKEKQGAGRKELADDKKSDKTIANREAMN